MKTETLILSSGSEKELLIIYTITTLWYSSTKVKTKVVGFFSSLHKAEEYLQSNWNLLNDCQYIIVEKVIEGLHNIYCNEVPREWWYKKNDNDKWVSCDKPFDFEEYNNWSVE